MKREIYTYINTNYISGNQEYVKLSFLILGIGIFCVIVNKKTKKVQCQKYLDGANRTKIITGQKNNPNLLYDVHQMAQMISNQIFDQETIDGLICGGLYIFKSVNLFCHWEQCPLKERNEKWSLRRYISEFHKQYHLALQNKFDFSQKPIGNGDVFYNDGESEEDDPPEESNPSVKLENGNDEAKEQNIPPVFVKSNENELSSDDFNEIYRQIKEKSIATYKGKEYCVIDLELYERDERFNGSADEYLKPVTPFRTVGIGSSNDRGEGVPVSRATKKMAKVVDSSGIIEVVKGNFYNVCHTMTQNGNRYVVIDTEYGKRALNEKRVEIVDVFDECPRKTEGMATTP